MPSLIARLTCTITNGQSLSAAVILNGMKISVIEMPATLTACYVITFQGSYDGSNFFNIYDELGREMYIVAAASLRIHVDKPEYSQLKSIKLRTGLSGYPVTQGGDRAIYLEVWD